MVPWAGLSGPARLGGGVLNVGTVTDRWRGGGLSGPVYDDHGRHPGRNHAGSYGGALDIGQQITVRASTLAGNGAGGWTARGMGAAAEINGGATLIVSDSTIAGNTTRPAGARSTISGAA